MSRTAFVPYLSPMPDQPDPPDKWRVYKEDKTPDPEPPLNVHPPTSTPPQVPYGQSSSYNPVIITSSGSSAAPKIVLLVVALLVLGGVVAGAIAIFAAVGGIGGLGGGIDAKDPDDFAEFTEEFEKKFGRTDVQSVNLYSDYIIVYLPYSEDRKDDRQISYTWRGGDEFEEWTRSTSTEPTFDLSEIDTSVIDGMCDSVLSRADGATPDNCYIFLSKPAEGSDGWFRASASDSFNRSVWTEYDLNGVEVARSE